MKKKRTVRMPTNENRYSIDLVGEQSEVKGSGEGRRFLKHMDRRLLRFSNHIDSLEERTNRLSDDVNADLVLEVKQLHRETLRLRSEIREQLAGGNRNMPEMLEYAEEFWEQLRDSFEELKGDLQPGTSLSKPSGWKGGSDDSDVDEDTIWDEEERIETSESEGDSEVHPPRAGPRR